jgi:transposase InsO family protein
MRQVALTPGESGNSLHCPQQARPADCHKHSELAVQPHGADVAYVSDFNYIHTCARQLYLATILDLYAPNAVGRTLAPSMAAKPVCPLGMAISGGGQHGR